MKLGKVAIDLDLFHVPQVTPDRPNGSRHSHIGELLEKGSANAFEIVG